VSGLSRDHVPALASLPMLHRDPFDGMLAAQALAERQRAPRQSRWESRDNLDGNLIQA
jgi:PIN domain nuclease of toxin-antitoxin system